MGYMIFDGIKRCMSLTHELYKKKENSNIRRLKREHLVQEMKTNNVTVPP